MHVSGGAAAGAGALAFVVHGPDGAGTGGLQLFYRFGAICYARAGAAGFASGAGDDGADGLSTERGEAGGSDAPLCRPAGERHCRAERVSADDAAADDSGPGGGGYDASRGVVEGAAGDCGAGSDHTRAGERREDTGGGAAPTRGTAGVEEAVSGGSQVCRRGDRDLGHPANSGRESSKARARMVFVMYASADETTARLESRIRRT